MKALQSEVGSPLFEKVGTGLRANAAGRKLAETVAVALDRMAEGWDAVRREARAPTVHVACSASFAMGWLVPQLPKFSQAHPEIAIRLSMTSAREMRDEREADFVVLWDRAAYPVEDQRRAIPLGDSRFGLVAAPHYPVERRGDGAIFAPCRIVHDHTSRAWDQWRGITGMVVEAPIAISFPHTHLCLGAAAAGMGVAIAERRLAAAEIVAGRLAPITDFAPFPDGFAAIPHRTKPPSREADLFIEWLSAEL
jgi:DNA-binding transcriptional LysR family regulator